MLSALHVISMCILPQYIKISNLGTSSIDQQIFGGDTAFRRLEKGRNTNIDLSVQIFQNFQNFTHPMFLALENYSVGTLKNVCQGHNFPVVMVVLQ